MQGDKGSVIESSDSVRVKLVCPPPEQSLQAARAFSAPEGFPQNEVSVLDGVCVLLNRSNKQPGQQQRQCYDDALSFIEFTLQVRMGSSQFRVQAVSAWVAWECSWCEPVGSGFGEQGRCGCQSRA